MREVGGCVNGVFVVGGARAPGGTLATGGRSTMAEMMGEPRDVDAAAIQWRKRVLRKRTERPRARVARDNDDVWPIRYGR